MIYAMTKALDAQAESLKRLTAELRRYNDERARRPATPATRQGLDERLRRGQASRELSEFRKRTNGKRDGR